MFLLCFKESGLLVAVPLQIPYYSINWLMKTKHLLLVCLLWLHTYSILAQAPPYAGTIFINPDIIIPNDPSALKSTVYTGQGERKVYDRRVKNWIKIQAYLFQVLWDDGLEAEIIVNPEFRTVAAATAEAEKYAYIVGQLPYCLRVEVKKIAIHKGKQLFGGGVDGLLVHTEQAVEYEAQGILEETLAHEATHASLQAHNALADWTAAQQEDQAFISDYAKERPEIEDVAESFLMWLAVRYKKDILSAEDLGKITQTIPNRLHYFDKQAFELHPLKTP